MARRLQIAVLGSSREICTKKEYEMAQQMGEEIAKAGAATVTGGGFGVMEAAMKGAKKYNGLTVGIMPWGRMEHYNQYCDIVIATGIGFARDAINVDSCDGAILVGGGAGTLNEATFAYIEKIPVISLIHSGGTAKKIANTYLDGRKSEKIISAENPREAMKKLLVEIKKKLKNPKKNKKGSKKKLW